MEKSNVTAICLSVTAGEQMRLFVMVDEGGSINRIGTIASDSDEDAGRDMFIGKTDPAVFTNLRNAIPDYFFEILGKSLKQPDLQGTELHYEVIMRSPDGEKGFEVLCAGETGIPEPFYSFINTACSITRDWYEKQKQMVRQAGK